jgi:uncharacterized protein (DUF433 family)
MKSDEVIINRGRGPEIKGTRITVYSILDYILEGWHPHRIAAFFRISSPEVEAAWQYIREHTLEVLKAYVQMLERAERGNPPELQAKLDAGHARFQELVAKIRQLPEMDPDARQARVQELVNEHRQAGKQEAGDAGGNGRQ